MYHRGGACEGRDLKPEELSLSSVFCLDNPADLQWLPQCPKPCGGEGSEQDTGWGCCRKEHLARAASESCRLCALASFRGQPREQSPWGEGIVCTKCLLLPEACTSPGHSPQLAGTHLPSAGRTEGALSHAIHQGVMGAPQAPLAQGPASSPSAWRGEEASSLFLLSGLAAAATRLLPLPRLTPAAGTQAQTSDIVPSPQPRLGRLSISKPPPGFGCWHFSNNNCVPLWTLSVARPVLGGQTAGEESMNKQTYPCLPPVLFKNDVTSYCIAQGTIFNILG